MPSHPVLARLLRVLGYLSPHRPRFAAGVGLTLGGIALDLAKPLPLALVLDVVLGDKPLPRWAAAPLGSLSPLGLLTVASLAIVGLTLLRGTLTFASNHLTIDVGQRMVGDLRTEIYAHLQRLSLSFHHRQQTGDLLFRVMADTYSVQSMVMNGLLPIASAVVMLGGMFAVMAGFDTSLAAVALLVCPPLYLAVDVITRRIHGHATASKEAESALYARTETTIGAIKLVQAYGREARAVSEFREGSERSLALSLRLYNTETLFILVVDTLLALGTAGIVWLGARHVLEGTLSIGDLTIFLSYLKDLYQPIQSVAHNLKEVSSSWAGLDRVFAVLDVEPDVRDAPDAAPLPPVRGEVALENVSFGYDPAQPVLRGVSLRLAPGEKVALVGRTGAGKTTLAGLVLRFFDPQVGKVTVDGHDLRHVRLRSLRDQCTLMLQEPIVFPLSVTENIAFGAPDASPEAVREAARQADAEPFVLALPQGYDSVLGQDGSDLSGGQRQRLALARALLRRTPIVVLDEPTSSLDVATEETVWRNVEGLLSDRTLVVIAHRLSTARRCDRIVVLEEGRLTEQGSHEQLLARGGTYAAMWEQHVRSGRPLDAVLEEVP